MGSVGKVENGKPVQKKFAVVNACIATNIDHDFSCLEFPVRLGKLAGCNAAVVHDIVIRTRFFDALSCKSEWRCGSQNGAATVKSHSRCGCYVIERAGFRDDVVGAMTRPDVVVCWPAIDPEIS